MPHFDKLLLCVFALTLISCSGVEETPVAAVSQPKATLPAIENSYSLSEKKLLEILDAQNRFFEYFSKNPRSEANQNISLGEYKTKVGKVEAMWAEYVRDNPKDVHALILYGKFLRNVGDVKAAYEVFQKADSIDSGIAVVKQQMATYEAEQNDAAAAYKHIIMADALDPKTHLYKYQLGELLYLMGDDIVKSGILSRKECDEQMLGAFKSLSLSQPKNKNFARRYAQTFYDIKEPDWNEALAAWDMAYNTCALMFEKEEVLINKAHVLINLQRPEDAKALLSEIKNPRLSAECQKLDKQADILLEELNKKTVKDKKTFAY